MHAENGIPIDTWTSDRNDESLLDLLPFLDALRFTRDVRSILQFRVCFLDSFLGNLSHFSFIGAVNGGEEWR